MTPDVIADRIAQDIRDCTFPSGAQLVQEEIAKKYGVSRNPVREALRLLEARGLVTIRGGGGATVRVLSEGDLVELYALRTALEPLIAEPVVDGATSRAVLRLRRLTDSMEHETDQRTWMNLNFEFHEALYELADRPRTTEILSSLLSAAQPYSRRNIGELGGRAQADDDHRAMVDAIEARDATGLGDAIRRHLTSAEQRLEDDFTRDASA
ncbi:MULTISPECIES: GntR family transcriptional regulator [unclassified Rathayibacter]|uniref:GntR family transcriptional regulator n=1 Tax=unclassified Rathayibacter TaxID=2609250 RepID=UPI0006F3BF7E|nr:MULTISPECIES: GntR family transcriptional regulator [unclassified Rathayibacter]KQQ05944.1 transcriptional regulator [Rathayibacter sp. Leaf294]KQS13801.1 transcriptional regulator [Rathayibacter sp. Leaf185]